MEIIDPLAMLEELLTIASGGPESVGTLRGRLFVAMACGYMDARTMVNLMQTYGLPLSICAQKSAEQGLSIDYSGLRYELEKIGKKPETIDSELNEVKYFIAAMPTPVKANA